MVARRGSDWFAADGRIARWWADFQWPVIAAVVAIAFVLAYIGSEYHDQSFGERIYRTMVAFGLARPRLQGAQTWPLAVARWLLVLVALFAVFKAWGAIFREQAQRLRLRRRAGHVVICGGGDQGFLLATAFRERGDEVVLIERDPGSVGLQNSPERGVITIVGNALDEQLLTRAGVQRAACLLALCGDDGTNAEIAARARALLGDAGNHTVNCYVHIGDLDLYHLIREREIQSSRREPLRLQCFNAYETGARVMLREHPLTPAGAAEPPHAIIIGLGRFGQSLAIHAARSRHTVAENAEKLRLTVVDLQAARKVESLQSRYPALERTCTFLPLDLDVRSGRFQDGGFLTEASARHGRISAVYFCLRDEPTAISAALGVRHALRQHGVQAIVRVRQDAGLVALLAKGPTSVDSDDIQFFGLLPRVCDLDVVLNGTNEILARAIHERYVAARGADLPETNPSLASWAELPADLKEVNREQADHVGAKLARIGYRIAPLVDWTQPLVELSREEVEQLAVMEHERWMEQLIRQEWTLDKGPKDTGAKRHPDLVPWDQLDEAAKEKDRQAVRAIPPLLASVGFRVVRVGGYSATNEPSAAA